MKNSFLRLSSLLALPVAFSMSPALMGQSGPAGAPQDAHGIKVVEIHPQPTPTPFPLDAHFAAMQELMFRAPDQMTEADRNLVLANEAEIARRAQLQGFRLIGGGSGESGWGYEQAVCPVFPEHIILEYSRGEGDGDATLFSVVIPRGEGHVRVIPVRRKGYSLFTPASSNALTLNDFNHMVKEGEAGLPPDWLTLGLCYTALAGGHVRAALIPGSPAEEAYPLRGPAMLRVSRKGGADVRIADTTPKVKSMAWSLTFAQSGRLLKVQHNPADGLFEKPLAPTVAEKIVPVPGAAVDLSKTGN